MVINVDVAQIAAALKINDAVYQVACDVVRNGVRPSGEGQGRSVRDKWAKFVSFSEATGLPHQDALAALEENLDETATSVHQITQRRIEAERGVAEKFRKQAEKAGAYVANITEQVIAEFGKLPVTPFNPSFKYTTEGAPETAVLNCSDWHIGSAWPDEDTGFGDMSSNILSRRVETLTSKVLGLTKLQRQVVHIPRIHINFLGDICENDALHASSGVQVDQPTVRQMMWAVNAMERMIRSYLVEFEEVTVAAVWGNHGRMGAKGEQHPQNNWDNLAYHFLAERFADEPRVKILISTLPFMAFTLPGHPDHVHCILHGDGVPAPLGIPFYSLARMAGNLASMLDRSVHFLHLGHFHQSASLEQFNGERIINGSLIGTSPYAISLRVAGEPKQRLIGIGEDGKTWDYNVRLGSRRRFEPDANGVLTPYATSMGDHLKIGVG